MAKRQNKSNMAIYFFYGSMLVFLMAMVSRCTQDKPERIVKAQTRAMAIFTNYYTDFRDGDLYFHNVTQGHYEVIARFGLRDEYFHVLDALPFKQQQSEGRELCPPSSHAGYGALEKGYGLTLDLRQWSNRDKSVMISC